LDGKSGENSVKFLNFVKFENLPKESKMKKLVIVLLCFALMMQLADCGKITSETTGTTATSTDSTELTASIIPPTGSGKRSVDAQLEEIRQEGGWEKLVRDDSGHHQ
jgi:hypothetical protein